MSTIIQRTNPDRKLLHGGTAYVCCVCGAKYSAFDQGKACAEADVARRTEGAAA